MQLLAPPSADACVWMTAGLLSYKLCDREYDCEHCPLDAAMRGDAHPGPIPRPMSEHPGRHFEPFPNDRLYARGHTWLKRVGRKDDRFRFGLDSFGAALIATLQRVRWGEFDPVSPAGATICELELDVGLLRLGTPITARVSRRNREVLDDPGAVATAPYGSGWIVELMPIDCGDLATLLTSGPALEQARLDFRHFSRRVAHALLANTDPVESIVSEANASLADICRILGATRYLGLVRELVG